MKRTNTFDRGRRVCRGRDYLAAADDQVSVWNELGAQAAFMAGQSIPASRTWPSSRSPCILRPMHFEPGILALCVHGRAPAGASVDAAVATAAHDALVGAGLRPE